MSDIFVVFDTARLTTQFCLTELDLTEMPAYNERFCKSGAVTRGTSSAKNHPLYFVASSVEAPPSQSRVALSASGGQRAGLFRRTLTRLDLTVLRFD
jgi:hypothetical protein